MLEQMRRVGIEPTTYTNNTPEPELNPAGIAVQEALLYSADPDRTEPESATETQFSVIAHGHEFLPDPVIYGLADPRVPSRIRYVGQSKRGGLSRFFGHVTTLDSTKRGRWMHALEREGLYPVMVLLERVAAAHMLNQRENVWIYTLKKRDQADCNGALAKWWVEDHESAKKKQARKLRASRPKRETVPLPRVDAMPYHMACNILDELHGGSEWRRPRSVAHRKAS